MHNKSKVTLNLITKLLLFLCYSYYLITFIISLSILSVILVWGLYDLRVIIYNLMIFYTINVFELNSQL